MSVVNQWFKKGFNNHESGNLDEAERCYHEVLNVAPDHLDALYMLGTLYGEQGDYGQAEEFLKKAIEIEPNSHRVHNNIANVYRLQGKQNLALQHFDRVVEIEPHFLGGRINRASMWTSLARQNKNNDMLNEAEEEFREILNINPNHWMAAFQLANLLKAKGLPTDARKFFQRAEKLAPKQTAENQTFLANFALEAGDLPIALKHIREAYKMDPNDQGIAAIHARISDRAGDSKEALKMIEPWLEDAGIQEVTIVTLGEASIHAYGNDTNRIEKALNAINSYLENNKPTVKLLFTKANLLDKMGEVNLAFSAYQAANQMKLELAPYDIGTVKTQVEQAMNQYTASSIKTLPVVSGGSDRHIFIVGLPRSGSSLIEQILDSHPDASAAGEYVALHNMILELNEGQTGKSFLVENPEQLNEEKLAEMRSRYMSFLPEFVDQDKIIIDKALTNMIRVGLIMQMFPDAKILCMERDPYDTIMSCFYQEFGGGELDFSNSIDTLYEYFLLNQGIQQHWQKLYPDNMKIIDYNTFVEKPDSQIQDLLQFCGLPMDENCLKFYQNPRYSDTQSYHQVRQPIYQTASKRYVPYRQFVPDLISKLGSD